METVDLTVIGAGWSGLAAIKTYLQVNPSSNVILLEAASSIGGVWAKHRLYKGLKSNNMLGTYEFSDFPMDPDTFGVQPGQHIPGQVIQQYMEKFAEHFQFRDRIRLNTRVRSAEHRPDGTWLLTTEHQGEVREVVTRKLIVATGITSQAYLPDFPGQETFDAPLFHCRDLLQYEAEVLQDGRRITVFGGTKSAWDAVYAAATSGAQVDWVIRENGHGPVWMAPPYVTPLKKWLEKLVTTRLLTFFSPCIWGHADGYPRIRRFLHGTWLGRKIVDAFWGVLANDVIQLNRYDAHPETAKLKPWISPFWIASSLSILNYPTDFFDLVRSGAVRVHVANITRLSPGTVHLSSGTDLPSSALICSTGWKATPNLDFLPPGLDTDCGFPWAADPIPEDLLAAADDEILRRFPRLRNQPAPPKDYAPLAPDAPATAAHPFRLARFMVPCSLARERSLAFMGIAMTINTTLLAQAQALWITAFFGGSPVLRPAERCPSALRAVDQHGDADADKLDEKREEMDLVWETALHSQFGKWRYPGGFGKRNPDFVFDAIPYVDLLLNDLGVRSVRKDGILGKVLSPYGMEDYRGLVEEWMAARQ
ncbi:dimethylaniline monooxygenase [N-oxide-forming] 5 [Aspergillus lentulus]|uniref:Dimethylaniline monooxygenase [N-oxide-forming] 5 n=1 Tax=Aspergillus lentulus TaxID=293939 RepID=A0AAN4PBX4_ASPLE|nr:dimethylaniline monooxygenase [N-oxide-forming] 5 [Aspergillus lentulus]